MNLFEKYNHFNFANLITFGNIACGVIAMYFIQQNNFFLAIILAWIAGILDIADGKMARKYNLSTEFGVQLDSFADFLSFVVMPAFLLFYATRYYVALSGIEEFVLGLVFIWYIISGLRRLVEFNLKVDAGKVSKYFEGVPTPLGAILLWIIYLLTAYDILTSGYIIAILVLIVSESLNSNLKIPHP
ncbi:MAG: CDP-alcohol phosphatidyltransferase family protein [Sulfurovum sp.]|nr:CDP-alcohol phosphatidyltransferase family protein [Sulfurovum sp.]MCB4746136.1 CDP-alcohol phosphatidyltransferase family protein [Sulfurovum sp.]MCB4750083.1 CDP-alcohol phosphatidyltransferase family protein [Sulfurovum sp.]MCB4753108.1 CDP-alcohol phosphatidyltransferase family protein [Sulfurovum sp.]MCB4754047.1 CDP-alcohol phosphatidyltransferase family protein [Sulfurovum sp.]